MIALLYQKSTKLHEQGWKKIKEKAWKHCISGHSSILIKQDKITGYEVLFYEWKVSNTRFIPVGNEPGGHTCVSIWRMPRGLNTAYLTGRRESAASPVRPWFSPQWAEQAVSDRLFARALQRKRV
ncbi:hypothetical protein BRYFOR_09938 [Marvinbryantia formatexigens DSM 14469]|uniref:Uncharacterized protein n=1 Tax=Marvinbryantia formatexigens DSM 14469 TaxID=478749 RepID=C6LMN7_9FIRM|nr:hypothetical protein BRYFOR_09938 [Marvinbryantia formatexigens DSM 14469]